MPTLVIMSDSHGQHSQVYVPHGDILIHCGDLASHSTPWDLRDFLCWFEGQPHKHKIFIAGNHETWVEANLTSFAAMVKDFAPSCTYLHDSKCSFMGLNFWGSPYTPVFYDWAFNCKRGPSIRAHWDKIPANTDVLITHGPPYGFNDWSVHDCIHVGCEDLLEAIKRVKPRAHFSGHIHSGFGSKDLIHEDGSKTIVTNASMVNEAYRVVNAPWIWVMDL